MDSTKELKSSLSQMLGEELPNIPPSERDKFRSIQDDLKAISDDKKGKTFFIVLDISKKENCWKIEKILHHPSVLRKIQSDHRWTDEGALYYYLCMQVKEPYYEELRKEFISPPVPWYKKWWTAVKSFLRVG